MIFDFMRLILFYDLPVVTENEKRIYTKFRKSLIKNGYIMIQYSVYAKIFNNRDVAVKHIAKLKNNLPEKGAIRIMLITEKQYCRMEILVGGRSNIEEQITSCPLIIL